MMGRLGAAATARGVVVPLGDLRGVRLLGLATPGS